MDTNKLREAVDRVADEAIRELRYTRPEVLAYLKATAEPDFVFVEEGVSVALEDLGVKMPAEGPWWPHIEACGQVFRWLKREHRVSPPEWYQVAVAERLPLTEDERDVLGAALGSQRDSFLDDAHCWPIGSNEAADRVAGAAAAEGLAWRLLGVDLEGESARESAPGRSTLERLLSREEMALLGALRNLHEGHLTMDAFIEAVRGVVDPH
jgi:hypothetical protein